MNKLKTRKSRATRKANANVKMEIRIVNSLIDSLTSRPCETMLSHFESLPTRLVRCAFRKSTKANEKITDVSYDKKGQ